jgi:hypothetical protein
MYCADSIPPRSWPAARRGSGAAVRSADAAGVGAIQLLDGRQATRNHAAGRLPVILRQAGLAAVETYARLQTAWGTLELLDARTNDGGAAPTG